MSNDKPKVTREQCNALRDEHEVRLRDLAVSLLDDPFEADDVVRRVFRRLRRFEASDVGTGAEAAEWLTEYVINRCIDRFADMVEREHDAHDGVRRRRRGRRAA
jgi:DNA-directed RNA polymerase specialized sigma24 family protein